MPDINTQHATVIILQIKQKTLIGLYVTCFLLLLEWAPHPFAIFSMIN